MLSGFKKIHRSGWRPEMLLINKNEKKYRHYTALSKSAAARADKMNLGYVEILVNEKTKMLAVKPVKTKTKYSARIGRSYRIPVDSAWKQLEDMGFSIKNRYTLTWNDDSACWTEYL